MTKEEFIQFTGLASKLVDVVQDEIADQKELGLEVITAALLDVTCFWVAQCPVAVRQDMVKKFRKHLLSSIETNIEEKVQIFDAIPDACMTEWGQA